MYIDPKSHYLPKYFEDSTWTWDDVDFSTIEKHYPPYGKCYTCLKEGPFTFAPLSAWRDSPESTLESLIDFEPHQCPWCGSAWWCLKCHDLEQVRVGTVENY